MGHKKNISISKLKKNALKSLKGNWGLAVLANILGGIILFIPSLISGSRSYETIGRISDNLESIERGYNNYSSFGGISGAWLSILLNLLLAGAIAYGISRFNLNLIRDKDPKVEDIFSGFSRYGKTLLISLLWGIFKFLWSLLLIIPFIILIVIIAISHDSTREMSAGLIIFTAIAVFATAISIRIFLTRYEMAYYIFNDNDNIDSMEALKKSIELMNGYKIKYFLMHLSFIGWGILSVLTIGIGLLFLWPYIRASQASFYQEISIGDNPLEVIEF